MEGRASLEVKRGNYAGSKEVADKPAGPEGTESQDKDEMEAVDGPRRSGPSSPLLCTRFALHEDHSE